MTSKIPHPDHDTLVEESELYGPAPEPVKAAVPADYEPFGPEWYSEVLKLSKRDLVHLYKMSRMAGMEITAKAVELLGRVRRLERTLTAGQVDMRHWRDRALNAESYLQGQPPAVSAETPGEARRRESAPGGAEPS